MTRLNDSRLKQAEFTRTIYQAVPEAGTPLENLLTTDCWAHVARRLKPTDRIEVLPEDGSYYAELMVLDCGRTWAKVAVINRVELQPVTKMAEGAAYRVEWAGPHARFRVARVTDGEVMQDKFQTREQAEQYAKNIEARAA